MVCPVCGSENDARLVFCGNCGNRLRSARGGAVAPTPPVGMRSAPQAETPTGAAPASRGAALSRPSAPLLELGMHQRAVSGEYEAPPEAEPGEEGPQWSKPPVADDASPPDRGTGSTAGSSDQQTCHDCGATSPPGYRFCLGCGAVLGTTRAARAAATPEPQGPAAAAAALDAPPLDAQRVVSIEGDTSAAVVVSCPRCGAVSSGGETTCRHCGAAVAGLAPGGSARRPAEPERARGPLRRRTGRPAGMMHHSDPPIELSPERRIDGGPYHLAPSARPDESQQTPSPSPQRPSQGRPRAASRGLAGRLIVIVEDGSEGAVLELRGDQVDVGRVSGDIVLSEDRYMSPRHARLFRRDGAWYLRDLDSTNGVYRRLRTPEALADGDLVLLGLEVLQFELVDHAERGLGHAMEHGTFVFGSPAASRPARLCQRTVEGIVRDVYHLVSDETTIGREIGDIVFTSDPFMSRRHAAIKWQEATDQYVLADLNSSNGTYLAIRGDVRLEHGDFIRIGQHLFRADLPQ